MTRSSDNHLITVAGRAERQVEPDRARWSLTVEVSAAEPVEAFNRCSQQTDELLVQLRAVIDDRAELSTDSVRVEPRWDSERRRHVGFAGLTVVSVDSPVELAAKVAQAAIGASLGQVRGPHLRVSDPEPIRNELLSAAVEAARAKAELLASAAGRELGRVVAVRERGLEPPTSYVEGELVMSNINADSVAEPQILPGTQLIAAEVVVAFDLLD